MKMIVKNFPSPSEKVIGEFLIRCIGGMDESTVAAVSIAKLSDVE